MNKLQFCFREKQEEKTNNSCLFYKLKKPIRFEFSSKRDVTNIISEEQSSSPSRELVRSLFSTGTTSSYPVSLPGQIIKTDIKENVVNQFKKILKDFKINEEELLYLKMSKKTKDKFRIYYSYEVSYIPKKLSCEDKEIGKIVGCMMGIKIVNDETIEDDFVIPVIRAKDKILNNRFKNLLKEDK